jgi:hypothetical protein
VVWLQAHSVSKPFRVLIVTAMVSLRVTMVAVVLWMLGHEMTWRRQRQLVAPSVQ